MLVNEITFVQAKRTIRELVMDLGLVNCFTAVGQDLSLFKDNSKIVIGGEEHQIVEGEFDRLYDLVGLLVDKNVSTEFLIDYVPTDTLHNLRNFNITLKSDEPYTIQSKNYFSDEVIESLMLDFFAQYMCYDGVPRTTEDMFGQLQYVERRKLIFWVSFWLLDRKRMLYASAKNLINISNGICDTEYKNTSRDTTVRVGETYTENERVEDDGDGLSGFTSLWGDKFSYLTKLQLYLRNKFEILFGDYSLREDSIKMSNLEISKTWQNDAWIDTLSYSYDTYNILVGARDSNNIIS